MESLATERVPQGEHGLMNPWEFQTSKLAGVEWQQ
jgi:hypothetical protein